MNARASRIIRRYCLSTRAPLAVVKMMVQKTPAAQRHLALAALERETNRDRLKKPTRAQLREHNRANSRLHITPEMQVDLLKQAAALNSANTQAT